MIASLPATSAVCAPSPAALLAANRRAMGARPTRGTATARYTDSGQGLEGWSSSTFDLASGRFVVETETLPFRDLHGFDGRIAWFRDLSGGFVPQGANGRRAIAVSEAYLNAQRWWREDRGGARLELIGCNALRVTPRGGNAFEAHFDGTTKLLSSLRQTMTFGVTTETRFSGYQPRAGLLVPTRIEVVTEDDPSSRETLRLASFTLAAQRPAAGYAMPASRPSDWSLPPSGRISIPFRLLNNHVIVDVRVNGRGPFPFLLDTGGHDIVTPATLAALGLASQGETPSGGGGEGLTTNGYARIERLDVGGATLAGQIVATIDFSPFAVEGIHLGGMLGVEFLERFVVRIDYGRRTLTVIDPARFDAAERRRSGAAIPFTFYEHMPQIDGAIDGRPARLNIDTGSRSDVTLTSPFVRREGFRRDYPNGILATEGWGVGGPTRSYVVRARSMRLGRVEVPGPIAGLSTARKGALSDAFYDANVGSGALKRFIVTFDYRRRIIYLKPAARLDPDTGHFDRSGMWLNLADGGLAVMDVAQNGPADSAGLRAGDVVTELGGHSVLDRPLSDVRSSLKTAPVGQPLAVAYLRAGRRATTILVPRELVPDRGTTWR